MSRRDTKQALDDIREIVDEDERATLIAELRSAPNCTPSPALLHSQPASERGDSELTRRGLIDGAEEPMGWA